MNKNFIYLIDDKDYQVEVTSKRVKNINYHYKDGVFKVSCPWYASTSAIKSGLDKFAKKLINRFEKRKEKPEAETDNYIYLFGEKYDLFYPQEISLSIGKIVSFNNREELDKKIKKVFLEYLVAETNKIAEIMSAPKYQIKIRKMHTRYGTNSRKTKSITYSLDLIHYSPEIISSVIAHELVHCFVFDHSDNFYRLLYKYSPNYDILRKKLIKAVFK